MKTQLMMGRRQFLFGATGMAVAVAGCTTTPRAAFVAVPRPALPDAALMYAAIADEQFPVPAARIDLIDPKYYRQVVKDPTGEKPGTIVVDTPRRFLYLVQEDGHAIRYGVGIGRDGFAWGGRARIQYKRKWPKWTPPSEMIDRQPELEKYRHGMSPGLDNPLGARALYIFEDGKDTLYRLHGNMDARSIGRAVSSGCVRLLFQDVIDLYERVPDGTSILVLQTDAGGQNA
ncbi:Lipoprotein-anchoring transpeptidase ErfK/SrfK [Mesorhizobium qingshengii]|uniref:Lipoprotein-anchoring transpeptidase ErfK/SrfK n=2 Tax=Mesorhizobium qingshengii TaxID=1165689 RepID=A0A1G5ZPJ8_9HYPH|nr:Lipoprotein-anchoring transpeptidase ErfK/SrfK [Mesorhizobium qingshengii]